MGGDQLKHSHAVLKSNWQRYRKHMINCVQMALPHSSNMPLVPAFCLSPFRTSDLLSRPVTLRSPLSHPPHQHTVSMKYDMSSVAAIEWLKQPIAVRGKVQRGFGRGSRDLGTPTANLPGHLVQGCAEAERDGVYLGFGRVPKYGDQVVKMVANLGRNVTYGDVKERVLEAYLLSDEFDEEFYGEEMRLCLLGFMRPERKFNSIEELMKHINNDVEVAREALDVPEAMPFRKHTSLTE